METTYNVDRDPFLREHLKIHFGVFANFLDIQKIPQNLYRQTQTQTFVSTLFFHQVHLLLSS